MLITVIFFCQVCSYCFNTQCRDSYGRVLLHCNLKLLKSFFFFNLNLSLSFLLVRICLVYGSPFFHSWSPVSLYFNCVLSTELEFVKPTCIWFLYAKFTPLIFIIMTNILGSLYIYLCVYMLYLAFVLLFTDFCFISCHILDSALIYSPFLLFLGSDTFKFYSSKAYLEHLA